MSEAAVRDLQNKNRSLEQALVALRAQFEEAQLECDAECEKRLELALELQQAKEQIAALERQLKIERITNADYAAERVDLLDRIEALKLDLRLQSSDSKRRADTDTDTDDDDDDDDDEGDNKSESEEEKEVAITADNKDDAESDGDDGGEPVHEAPAAVTTAAVAVAAASPAKDANPANRIAAVTEIVDSERRFVAFLTKMLSAFRDPMMSDAGGVTPLVNGETSKKLFLNVEVILNISRTLLSRLDERLKAFDNDKTPIADVFLAIQPFLKAYNEYANKVDTAFELLEQLKHEARFSDWLGAVERMHGTALRDLMVMPVQRLPRYVMLLEQVVKHTPPAHPDAAALAKAAAVMKETTEHVNARRAEYESLSRVRALGARMVGYDPFAAASGVLHCRDGVLLQTGPDKAGDVHVILLSNVLLTARRTSTMANLRTAMSRGSGSSRTNAAAGSPLRIREVVQLYKGQTAQAVVGEPLAFIVDIAESSLTRPLKFQCESTSERDAWISAIRAAVAKLP